MSSCFQCGAQVTPDDRFCGNCGTALKPPARVEAGHSQPFAPPDFSASATASAPSFEHEDEERTHDGDLDAPASNASNASDANNASDAPNVSDETGEQPQQTPPAAYQLDETIIDVHPQPGGFSRPFSSSEPAKPVEPLPPVAESVSSESEPSQTSAPADASGANDALPAQAPPSNEMARGADYAPPGSSEPLGSSARLAPRTERTGSTGGGRSQPSKQLEAGTLLNGRYEIARRIGGGGMGAVYYAKDRNLGDAPRAVKEMIQSQLDESQHEKAIDDFRRESMLLASLKHPSIPTIYDYFYDETASRFYLVMEYISGGDFLLRLKNAPSGRIDEQTVADWGMQVADVLDYLHNRRPAIIYRDLKPANLMIDGNSGRVMLIDFGIARWVAPQEKGVTAVGTMGYAPPELFSGKVEPRSDIYSLGATMFHLLTGSDPQDNPLLIFDFTKHPRPRQINPAISNEMDRILVRATEYKPENRFRSAAELRETLAAHLERLRVGAVSYGGASFDRPTDKTVAVEMVFCGFCGGRIAADDVFCAHCGAKQPLANASAALRAARATAKLVVAGTTELDASFQLNKDTNIVGRTDPHSNIFPEVDLSKFDPETKISRRHARIWREGDTFLVEDLGSVNGTVINDSIRLGPRQPRALENGDKLRLGETTLHFLIG
ncbi:MAG TPA: protein kinase [Pyrinomonadaceae bacterium]|jgi:serine/threonine-protein kinase